MTTGYRSVKPFIKVAAKLIGLLATLLLLPTMARAQGGFITGQAIAMSGKPAAFATVRVCNYAGGGGLPCSPLSSIYSDLALTHPVSNPYTTDNAGNYSIAAADGAAYIVQVTVSPGTVYSYLYSISASGTVTEPGGSNFNVQYNNNGTSFGGAAVNGLGLFSTAAIPRAAAATDVSTLLQTASGCTTPGNAYSPQTNTCIPSSGGAPAAPSFAVQLANSGASAFAADPNILINPSTHTFTTPNLTVSGLTGSSQCATLSSSGVLGGTGSPCGSGGGVVGPSFAVQAANSGVTAPITDANILINTSTHTLTSPNFIGTSALINGTRASCGLTGGTFGNLLCDNAAGSIGAWAPGQNGVAMRGILMTTSGGGISGAQLSGRVDVGLNINNHYGAQAITQDIEDFSSKSATGDWFPINIVDYGTMGTKEASDESFKFINLQGGDQAGYPHFTIATGGAGSQNPTFSGGFGGSGCAGTNNGCVPTVGSVLIDTQTPVAQTYLNGASSAFTTGCAIGLQQLPTTGGLPTFTAWGCVDGANVTVHTTPDNQVSVTLPAFTHGAGGSFAVNDVVLVVGDQHIEESKITGVSGTAPNQVVTLPLSEQNTNIMLIKGQLGAISFDGYLTGTQPTGYRTSYVGVMSTTGSDLVYATQLTASVGSYALPVVGSEPETTNGSSDPNSHITIFCSAFITQAQGSGSWLNPNICAWAPGDTAEAPNFPVVSIWGGQTTINMNEASLGNAPEIGHVWSIGGMGASNNSMGLDVDNNNSTPSDFTFDGGLLSPAQCAFCTGNAGGGSIWSDTIYSRDAPVDAFVQFQTHLPGPTSYHFLEDAWANIDISNGLVNVNGASLQSQFSITALGGNLQGQSLILTGFGNTTTNGISFAQAPLSGGSPTYFALTCQHPFSSDNEMALTTSATRSGDCVTPNSDLALNNIRILGTAGNFTAGNITMASTITNLISGSSAFIEATSNLPSDSIFKIENSSVSGASGFAFLDNTGAQKAGFGHGNASFPSAILDNATYLFSIDPNFCVTFDFSTCSANFTSTGTTFLNSVSAPVFTGTSTTTGPGSISMPFNSGTMATLPANSGGWAGPSVTGGTSYDLFLPPTITSGLLFAGAPTTIAGVNGSQVTSVSSAGFPSSFVLGWNSDTGLSRDSAGVVDVGNGTAGDKSGTINAATGTFGTATVTTALLPTLINMQTNAVCLQCGFRLYDDGTFMDNIQFAPNTYQILMDSGAGTKIELGHANYSRSSITADLVVDQNGNSISPSTGVIGWSAGVATAALDTGCSRDSAGVIDCGNGTAGDKSGTINAATGTFGTAVTVGGNNVITQVGRFLSSLGTGSLTTGTCLGGVSSVYSSGSSSTVTTGSFSGTASLVGGAALNNIALNTSFSTDTKVINFTVCNNSLSTWTFTGISVNLLAE